MVVSLVLILAGGVAHSATTDDLGALREQMRQLQEQNRALQQQLESQRQLIDSLGRKVEDLEHSARPTAENPPATRADDLVSGPLTKTLSTGRIMLSGQGAVGFYGQGSQGQFAQGGFVLDEAKLFVEANLYTNVYAFSEIVLAQREDPNENLRIGEFYLEWEDASALWGRERLLNLRLGRMYIPFGEEYQVRDAIYDPLISHSLTDFWGVDEGLELYGALDKFHYVFAVQNGGYPTLRDFNADKAVTLRLEYDPVPWLHTSVSGMRTGDLDVKKDVTSALWFGNGFIEQLGAPATTTTFHAEIAEGDVQIRWTGGHLSAAGGGLHFKDNDTTGNNSRKAWFYSVEGLQGVGEHFYAAGRVSQIVAPGGLPLVGAGEFGDRFYGNLTTGLWRLSLGLGWRVSRDLTIKGEYTINRGHELGGKPRDHEDFFGVQAAFRF